MKGKLPLTLALTTLPSSQGERLPPPSLVHAPQPDRTECRRLAPRRRRHRAPHPSVRSSFIQPLCDRKPRRLSLVAELSAYVAFGRSSARAFPSKVTPTGSAAFPS